jgi:hypothetical protein
MVRRGLTLWRRAATYIQAWFRGWLWRRAAAYIQAWFLRRTFGRAAATIQRHWRWVLWQSREWRRLSAAAKHIQAFWRTWRQRTAQSARIKIERQLEHLQILMGRCPIAKAIQRGARRHTAASPDPWRRPQVDPVVATAIIRIQSLFRGWRTRIRAAIACSTQVCLPTHFLYTVWHSYSVAIDTFYGIRCSARSRASMCKCTWVQLCSCAGSAGVQASLAVARKLYDVARMLSNQKKACNARQRRAHKAAAEARWDRLEASRLCPEIDAHFEIDPLDGVAYLEPNRLKRGQHSCGQTATNQTTVSRLLATHTGQRVTASQPGATRAPARDSPRPLHLTRHPLRKRQHTLAILQAHKHPSTRERMIPVARSFTRSPQTRCPPRCKATRGQNTPSPVGITTPHLDPLHYHCLRAS